MSTVFDNKVHSSDTALGTYVRIALEMLVNASWAFAAQTGDHSTGGNGAKHIS